MFSLKLKKVNSFLRLSSLGDRLESSIIYQWVVILLLSILLFFLLYKYLYLDIKCFKIFYGERLRGFLFSGFLTVGSFLLSLKTFVIVSLKEKLFDSVSYMEKYRQRNRLSKDDAIDLQRLYQPLANLTSFLYFSIIFSMITSIFQFTLGITGNDIAYGICIWMAIITLLLLMNCLRLIKKNISVWLGYK